MENYSPQLADRVWPIRFDYLSRNTDHNDPSTEIEMYGEGDKVHILPTEPSPPYNHVSECVKYSITVFAFLLWIIGGLLAAVGGYINTQILDYEHLSKLAFVPGSIVCITGALIFIMSTFGVLGSHRENIVFLNTYRVFLIAILLVEVCNGFLAIAFWPEVKKIVDIKITAGIRNYTEDLQLRSMMDLIQRELRCCGHLTIDDWDSNAYFSCQNVESYRHCGVPWSCCLPKLSRNRQCGLGIRQHNYHRAYLSKHISTEGCLDRSFEFFTWIMALCGGLSLASILPIVIAIIQTRRLVSSIRKNIEQGKERMEQMDTQYS